QRDRGAAPAPAPSLNRRAESIRAANASRGRGSGRSIAAERDRTLERDRDPADTEADDPVQGVLQRHPLPQRVADLGEVRRAQRERDLELRHGGGRDAGLPAGDALLDQALAVDREIVEQLLELDFERIAVLHLDVEDEGDLVVVREGARLDVPDLDHRYPRAPELAGALEGPLRAVFGVDASPHDQREGLLHLEDGGELVARA